MPAVGWRRPRRGSSSPPAPPPHHLAAAGGRGAQAAPLIVSHPGAAGRFGPPAVGLQPWQSYYLPGGPGRIAAQAVPAVHGPADGMGDLEGHVTCEATGFV